MGKKRCWFGWVKKIFSSDAKAKTEKKSRSCKWVFGRLKLKQYHPALLAPQKSLCQATEEQRKHALNVAIATAAAAEAAVAAAQAAAEVVRLAGASKPLHHFAARDRNWAAIKVQSSFRAHLARKALRALKGLVKLQAIIRGQLVRREAMKSLKSLQSSPKIYREVKEKCTSPTKVIRQDSWRKQSLLNKDELWEDIRHECNSQKSWNDSVYSKEDIEAIWLKRQEAMAKRERMKKYSYSHRERTKSYMLEETVHVKETGKSNFVEAEANAEANKRERLMILKPKVASNLSNWEVHGPPHIRYRNAQKQETLDGLNSPFLFPRRSFCRVQQRAAGDEGSIPNSPVFPTYMAATECAKAKARSLSTPRQRVGFLDTCFDYSVPYKGGLSFWSTYNGDSFSFNEKSSLPLNRLY
ncbi:IQ motif, EF-hand binding site [Corchorus olitorius]|uniref:IQ motif, EF-hand binding site n=1 Tax=Corchorus olitorius TaxID=93759 RepID=A0A1R3IU27_9ROSI|nr:IQ motif, EF-hand binding site [Corchorus olitorius]